VVNDLNHIAVRIPEVAGSRPVAMRSWLRDDRHTVVLQKNGPSINLVGMPHDEPEVVERRRS
jgi:hypothetical protein